MPDRPDYQPYPDGPAAIEPEPSDGPISFADAVPDPEAAAFVWHVVVEWQPGRHDLVAGVFAHHDEALEQAREQAHRYPGAAGLRSTERTVFVDGPDGFLVLFGRGTGRTSMSVRVVRAEP